MKGTGHLKPRELARALSPPAHRGCGREPAERRQVSGEEQEGQGTHLEQLLPLLQGGLRLRELELQQAVGVLLPLELLRTDGWTEHSVRATAPPSPRFTILGQTTRDHLRAGSQAFLTPERISPGFPEDALRSLWNQRSGWNGQHSLVLPLGSAQEGSLSGVCCRPRSWLC